MLQARIKILENNTDNKNNCKECEGSGFSPKMSGKEQFICLKKRHCQQSLGFVRPYGGPGECPRLQEPLIFYSPTYLSRCGLVF